MLKTPLLALVILLTFAISCEPTQAPNYSNAFVVDYNEETITVIANVSVDPSEMFEADIKFDTIWRFQQGIKGFTYSGRLVDTLCEGEGDESHTWYPNSPKKQVAAGVLELFKVSNGPDESDPDDDWNFHIKPLERYKNLMLIRPEAQYDWSFWAHGVPNGLVPFNGSRLKFEICAPEGLQDNPWFHMDGSCSMIGDTICGYGAWVTDGHHLLEDDDDTHPEIHPAELIWWKKHLSDVRDIDLYIMMATQDASHRFDSGDDYQGCDEPWMDSPLRATFDIAFIADTDGVCQNFVIGEIGGLCSNVTTSVESDWKADQGEGNPILLKYNGNVIVAVYENMMLDDDLGIKIVQVGLRPDGKIQGYVQVRTRVGSGGDDMGYHVLYALKSNAPAVELMKNDIFRNELPQHNLPKINPDINTSSRGTNRELKFVMRHRLDVFLFPLRT